MAQISGGYLIIIALLIVIICAFVIYYAVGKGGQHSANTSTDTTITNSSNQNSTDEPGAQAPHEPPGTQLYKNVTYCTINDTAYHLDVYIPNGTVDTPRSLVVYIHGGAWEANDKEHADGTAYFSSLISNGFVVVSINYGLAPQNKWPAMIVDSKCAIRYLKTNANQYDINPNEIGVFGSSAGGQIVSMLGVGALNQSWDSIGQWQNVSSGVQAVGDMFGPESLNYTYMTNTTYHGDVYCPVFSCSNQTMYLASPIIYVRNGDPPFLIQQGLDDFIVPYDQATMFYNALINNGVTANLTLVQNAGHGFSQVGPTQISPSKQSLIEEMTGFFNRYLNNPYGTQQTVANFSS